MGNQQAQQAEHEYDPYVQGGVSRNCRIWMHAGWRAAVVRHPYLVMDAYPVYILVGVVSSLFTALMAHRILLSVIASPFWWLFVPEFLLGDVTNRP